MGKNMILSGFGTFNDDPSDRDTLKELKKMTKALGIKFYPTYYDWSMEGDDDKIEKVTMAMWSMPKDQWEENCLSAEYIQEN